MDKSAVLHWLHDVEAASSNTVLNDSDRGSINPNTTRQGSLSPLGELPFSLHQNYSPHHHEQSLLPPQPPPTSVHVPVPIIRSSSLVPSSSFQIPENPGKNDPPEVIRKFLRSNTLSGSSVLYRPRQKKGNVADNEPGGKNGTGIESAAARGGNSDNVVFSGKRQVFPPPRRNHQKHHSLSQIPIPASHPEVVQPTIDLTNADLASPKRKMLIKSARSVSASIKLGDADEDSVSAVPSTLIKLVPVSPPKSAPVSPKLGLRKSSSILSEVKSLSHSNLANFDSQKKISDMSPNVSNRSSIDGQSHQAEKGEFSDAAMSDDSYKIHCDLSRSSYSDQELESYDTKDVKNVSTLESVNVEDLEERSKLAIGGEHQMSSTSPSSSSRMDSGTVVDKRAAVDIGEESVAVEQSVNREEELLDILKKWYSKGHGDREDLIRALEITGHRKSAYELMKDEDKEGQKQHGSLPSTDSEAILGDQTSLAESSSSNQPCDTSNTPVSPPPQANLLLQTMPPSDSTSPVIRYLTPAPPAPQSAVPCEPVNVLPLSRKKLAELDKANCFTFDDSSDEILDAKSSNMLAKKNSPLSSKTHSWSLSDYSGSMTSSSSYSNHAISPGVRTGSPTFSKLSEISDRKKLNNTSPRRYGHGRFPIPKETEEYPNMDRHLQSGGKPSNVITSARRLKLLSLSKSSSLVHDQYSPTTENMSHSEYKHT